MWYAAIAAAVVIAALAFLTLRKVRDKNLDIIARDFMRIRKRRATRAQDPRHVFFCFVDHYEPFWQGADRDTAVARVRQWQDKYPAVVDAYRDASGRPPQHSFFYPQEEYDEECLDRIADLCRRGCGDVEVHLHHDKDTSEGFRDKLLSFTKTLHEQHGLLRRGGDSRIEYGFIHGNWALDNSHPDGAWCGVNDEITILKQTGCYADFTYPSAPDPTQPPTINRIYYATDDPERPRSHHYGKDVEFGAGPRGDLLMIPGPLTVNWRAGRWLPAVENGDVAGHYPPTPRRVDLWVRTGISVVGYPSWVFVKVHTHGTQEDNARLLLGDNGNILYRHLLDRYNDGVRSVLHFVTARELYNCIKALEAGDRDAMRRVENFDYTGVAPRPGA